MSSPLVESESENRQRFETDRYNIKNPVKDGLIHLELSFHNAPYAEKANLSDRHSCMAGKRVSWQGIQSESAN
jgi:hypothetical protein